MLITTIAQPCKRPFPKAIRLSILAISDVMGHVGYHQMNDINGSCGNLLIQPISLHLVLMFAIDYKRYGRTRKVEVAT